MDLREKLSHVANTMRETKERWVAERPENTDLAIYLHFYRGDDLVATVICPLDRDMALNACSVAAAGFNAETVSITFEGYHSELPNSPITGEPWQHMEMQYVAQTDPDAANKGWVTECLTTSMHERGGQFGFHSQSFQVKEDMVMWAEAQDLFINDEGDRAQGQMFAYLQEVMARPMIFDVLREQAESAAGLKLMLEGLDEEARLYHCDAATVRALKDRQLASGVILMAKPDSNREQWIKERYGQQP